MSALDTLSHWRLARDPDGLAWLTFDRAASAVNALSADTMAELALVLDALDKDPPKGLVIRSGKPTGFIVAPMSTNSPAWTRPSRAVHWWRAAGTCSTGWPPCAIPRWP